MAFRPLATPATVPGEFFGDPCGHSSDFFLSSRIAAVRKLPVFLIYIYIYICVCVSKNRGTPKLNGKPYEQMDDLGVLYHYFWKHPYSPWESSRPNKVAGRLRMIHGARIPDPTKGQSLVDLDFLGSDLMLGTE